MSLVVRLVAKLRLNQRGDSEKIGMDYYHYTKKESDRNSAGEKKQMRSKSIDKYGTDFSPFPRLIRQGKLMALPDI